MRRLMRSESHARAQLSAKSAEAWHQKSIIECSFRLFKVLYPHYGFKSTIPRRMVYLNRELNNLSAPPRPKQRLSRTFQDAGSAAWRAPFRPRGQ